MRTPSKERSLSSFTATKMSCFFCLLVKKRKRKNKGLGVTFGQGGFSQPKKRRGKIESTRKIKAHSMILSIGDISMKRF